MIRALAILGYITISVALIIAGWIGYHYIVPVRVALIPVPVAGVEVSAQLWGLMKSDGSNWLTVENETGRTSIHMWEDWGPPQRSNYYLTPEGWLAVIAFGELVALVDFASGSSPRSINNTRQSRAAERFTDDWVYLGSLAGTILIFSSPDEEAECIAEVAPGWGRYRKSHIKSACPL